MSQFDGKNDKNVKNRRLFTSYDQKMTSNEKLNTIFRILVKFSYKIRSKTFFYKSSFEFKLELQKKVVIFVIFPICSFKNRVFLPDFTKVVIPPPSFTPKPSKKVFLDPHNTPKVTIIVIRTPPPKF